MTVGKVQEAIRAFCDTNCSGLIDNIQAHEDNFTLLRGKQPLQVIGVKMDVNKDADPVDVVRLVMASKSATSNLKVSTHYYTDSEIKG